MDTEYIETMLRERIEQLRKEGMQVAQQAANAAFEPYRVAIAENERLLTSLKSNGHLADEMKEEVVS